MGYGWGWTRTDRKLDGLVMFTDGGWNRGEDPVEAARALGVPVHVVGVGLPQAKDLEVTFVSCDDVVFKGDSFPLTVRIRARGYANRNLRLKILRDDQSIRDEVVALGAEGEVQHQVILPADRAGVFAFGAEVETLSDEASAENNRRSKAGVRVIDRRITVLLCEDSPRWEFRALREGLAADKARIQVKTWMRQADPGGLEGQVATFPRNADELRGYAGRTQAREEGLRGDTRYRDLLIAAANDPIMQTVQDEIATEVYWNRVQELSIRPRAIVSPLGQALLFDMAINHGVFHDMIGKAEQELGVQPKSRIGENGKSEQEVVTRIAQIRQGRMRALADRLKAPGLIPRGDFWVAVVTAGDWNMVGDARGEIEIKQGRRVQVGKP